MNLADIEVGSRVKLYATYDDYSGPNVVRDSKGIFIGIVSENNPEDEVMCLGVCFLDDMPLGTVIMDYDQVIEDLSDSL